ncbi:glycoside hydrolase family 43 protein [Cylindrobasidium torrendii FP15055 ss-10]|uniref:Glycoside hydrolase family 43 protein n=1 Tax=Cylindrobasidium torrendii FP15055 ss-10 TaxID=1314674 RepID=A0A0D7BW68_9AGAR|nr:glycoside hydrolase family 43 protein [Cylindrobasidium torrendii FP15055 ss-10]
MKFSRVLPLLCSISSTNPIIPGFNPDPSIQRVGKDYFLVTSSFEWFPGVPVYHSTDLIRWELIGHALNRPSQLDMRGTAPSGGIFAPTLRFNEEEQQFYMITTFFDVISPPDVTRTPRAFYVTTKNIWDDASWSDAIYCEQTGIDPDLFHEGGDTYLLTALGAGFLGVEDPGYFSIFKSLIDRTNGNPLTETELFHISTLPLDTPRLAEGPHLYKRDRWYYLMTAEAGTAAEHRVMIKRSLSVDGPWEENPANPILFNGKDLSQPVGATGHADLVDTPEGDWFLVFLGTRKQNPQNATGYNQLGRETFLAPVRWEDDWPIVNDNKPITLQMDGLYELPRQKIWRDDFDQDTFADKAYYTARTPYRPFHSLTDKPGSLRLRGNAYTLSDRETPAAFFRKQVDLEVVWSTEVDFQPTSERHEAGATVFLSIQYHNEIAVTYKDGNRVVVARTARGPTAAITEEFFEIPTEGTVKLFIAAHRDHYELGYALGDEAASYVAKVSNRWLQSYVEGWQVFTGTFFGVYATGNQLPILQPADFNFVQTELLDDVS